MLGHALGHAVITWASQLREAWLVMGVVTTATHGQTRLRGPFSKKQLIKTNWRRSGFYWIRMLKGSSPLLTSISDLDLWPQGPMASSHLKKYSNSSYHLPVCSGSDKGLNQKNGCASIATGRRLRDSTGSLFAFVNIWRLQNIIHTSVKPEIWISPQIKWLSV